MAVRDIRTIAKYCPNGHLLFWTSKGNGCREPKCPYKVNP